MKVPSHLLQANAYAHLTSILMQTSYAKLARPIVLLVVVKQFV